MHKVVFIYPNKPFLEFIRKFLRIFNYDVEISNDGVSGFNHAVKEKPELLIINKELPSIDLDGFFIKKRIHPFLKWTPSFAVGNFSQTEIDKFKKDGVTAFISTPINPYSLKERLNIHFKIPQHIDTKPKTPMIADMHAKGKIIVIQIEGNFEEDKLEILNYKLRTFLRQKKIHSPKILFIFPSIYSESITKENIDAIFGFLNFDELKIQNKNIKILSNIEKIFELLDKDERYRSFSRVPNYYEGIQSLNIDFDKNKTVPVEYLKAGSTYVYDLYDDSGDVRIPALSTITDDIKNYLLKSGLTTLTYYSDGEIDDISSTNDSNKNQTLNNFDFITSETEEVSDSGSDLAIVNDRINMFLNKLKGHNVLVITENTKDIEIIKNTLESYVNVDIANKRSDLESILSKRKYILALLDHHLTGPTALNLLQKIRSSTTRKSMSVIIIAKNINKLELANYKKLGTDYILLTPFNTTKLIFKIFSSITNDRRS